MSHIASLSQVILVDMVLTRVFKFKCSQPFCLLPRFSSTLLLRFASTCPEAQPVLQKTLQVLCCVTQHRNIPNENSDINAKKLQELTNCES